MASRPYYSKSISDYLSGVSPWIFLWFAYVFMVFPLASYSMEPTERSDYYYSEQLNGSPSLKDYIGIFPQEGEPLSVEKIIQLPDSLFYSYQDIPVLTGDSEKYWVKFNLTNDTDEKRRDYISMVYGIDSVEIYSVKEGILTFDLLTGYRIPPHLKRIPSRRNLYNFELIPGQSIDFYIKISPREGFNKEFLFSFFLNEDFYSMYTGFFYQTMYQIFLASILFLFALFSLVMFLSFKESIFVIYSALMMLMTLYFLDYHNILDYFIFLPGDFRRYLTNSFLVAGMIFFVYLFISQYLHLSRAMPRLNRLFFSLALTISLYSIFRSFIFDPSWDVGFAILNSLIIAFIIISFIPIILLSLRGIKQAKILLFSMFFMFAGGMLFTLKLLGILPTSGFTTHGFQWGAVAFSGTLFYGLFDKINNIQKEKLQFRIENDKTDELLFNILPYEVASELKEKGFCEARDYSNVHVMFTDFKDFTATSTHLSAKELVHEVNACFIAFDHIVEKYKVEKIKTIGDSYMAASGLETQTETKVKDIVLAAIEMQEFLNKRKEENLHRDNAAFQMRVGIHTGPVVAGIVGIKKFQYDIWGDTVNTASRVEEHGEVGKVNISDTTYEFIKDDPEFVFEERMAKDVKGKGSLKMWFVEKSRSRMEND